MSAPSEINQTIGNNILQSRESLGMTQHGLVAALREQGLAWHQNKVSRVETGKQPLRVDELPGVLAVFGDVLAGTPLEWYRDGTPIHRINRLAALLQQVSDSATILREELDTP